ncbi:hypothetical protein ACKKBG_A20315 [Auxenochlorella protothecoides x Auxenochlorella symbiontica]
MMTGTARLRSALPSKTSLIYMQMDDPSGSLPAIEVAQGRELLWCEDTRS